MHAVPVKNPTSHLNISHSIWLFQYQLMEEAKSMLGGSMNTTTSENTQSFKKKYKKDSYFSDEEELDDSWDGPNPNPYSSIFSPHSFQVSLILSHWSTQITDSLASILLPEDVARWVEKLAEAHSGFFIG